MNSAVIAALICALFSATYSLAAAVASTSVTSMEKDSPAGRFLNVSNLSMNC